MARWVYSTKVIQRLWFRSLSRARIYRRLILIERPLSEPVSNISPRVPVTVRVLADSEIGAYTALRPQQDPAQIRRRLDGGHWCFAVWNDQRIIHVAWAAVQHVKIEYLAWEMELAPDQVYVYDIFTAPAFRRSGAASIRSVEMMRYFRELGYQRLLGAVSPEDRSAFRQNVGYRRIGVIGYIALGPWRRAFRRSG